MAEGRSPRGAGAPGGVLEGATFDGLLHVDDWVPQRLVTASGPNPLPREGSEG